MSVSRHLPHGTAVEPKKEQHSQTQLLQKYGFKPNPQQPKIDTHQKQQINHHLHQPKKR